MTSDTSWTTSWSTEDRVTASAEESSSDSTGDSAEDAIERMTRLHHIRAKLVAAAEERCAVEEQLFGEPIAPGAGSPFIEKSFGSKVAPRQKRYLTSAGVSRDLSSIVVSIALFDGKNMLFACSGIPLPYGRTALRLTRFVTSARLATTYTANRNTDDNLRVEVRLPDNSTTSGLLGLYDRQIAIVTTLDLPSLHDVDLNPQHQMPSCGDPILAAGRAFTSGSLMAASGRLAAHESQSRKPSMCVSDGPLTEAVFGGPIIGTGGRFLGMGLPIDDSDDFTGSNVLFLRGVTLLSRLRHFGILNPKKRDFRGYSLPKDVFCASPSGFRREINRLKSLGYPMAPPLVLEFNGELLNRFEGYFGGFYALEGYPYDSPPFVYENYVWELLPKEVVSDISQHVVSLKSFHENVRYFACTGLLIWWPQSSGACSVILTSASLVRGHDNEYYTESLRCGASGVGGHDDDDHIKSLRIEVSLPQNREVTGTLEWYNVDYNIAIVSVGDYVCASRPENIFNAVQMPSRNALPTLGRRKFPSVSGKVLAIGRSTEKRLLMASIGEVKQRNKRIKLDSIGEVKQRNKRIKPGEVKQRNNGIKLDCRYLKLSTCKINKAGIGGPLINFGGSFVGMNFYDGSEETPFLPRSKIVEVLKRVVGLPLPSRSLNGRPEHIEYGARGRTRKNRWPVPEPYWYHGQLELDMYQLPEFRGRTRH